MKPDIDAIRKEYSKPYECRGVEIDHPGVLALCDYAEELARERELDIKALYGVVNARREGLIADLKRQLHDTVTQKCEYEVIVRELVAAGRYDYAQQTRRYAEALTAAKSMLDGEPPECPVCDRISYGKCSGCGYTESEK